jgi:hypothetical protein
MYGHNGKPIMRHLCDIAEECSLVVTCGPFFASALQKSHVYVYHSSPIFLAKVLAKVASLAEGRKSLP